MVSSMRKVLILDTETTGLDPATSVAIEVACIVFDVINGCAIESYATLIHHDIDENPAYAVNKIPIEAIRGGSEPDLVWDRVEHLAIKCDAIIAHNAEFDRGFVPELLVPWICSKNDLVWPRCHKPGSSLVNTALDHGLGVAHAHRAMADCELLSRLFTRLHDEGVDLATFLSRGLRPKAPFRALVSFEENSKAKAAGFRWEPVSKRWLKTMAIEDAEALPFSVVEVHT